MDSNKNILDLNSQWVGGWVGGGQRYPTYHVTTPPVTKHGKLFVNNTSLIVLLFVHTVNQLLVDTVCRAMPGVSYR